VAVVAHVGVGVAQEDRVADQLDRVPLGPGPHPGQAPLQDLDRARQIRALAVQAGQLPVQLEALVRIGVTPRPLERLLEQLHGPLEAAPPRRDHPQALEGARARVAVAERLGGPHGSQQELLGLVQPVEGDQHRRLGDLPARHCRGVFEFRQRPSRRP